MRTNLAFRACLNLLIISFMIGPLAAQQPDAPSVGQSFPLGPSFRVETEIFVGDSVQPSARHLILFDAGVIYDLRLDDDRLVTIYDPARGRVVLLDRAEQTQVEIPTNNLLSAAAQFRTAIIEENKSEAFGLDATVSVLPAKDEIPELLEIKFGDTRYTTTTQAVTNPAIANAYHEFAVMAARLNIIRRHGVPPFARLTLGEQIAKQTKLPLETTLEVRRGLKTDKYRSHLLVVEQLSATDRTRITEVGDLWAKCKHVDFEQFNP